MFNEDKDLINNLQPEGKLLHKTKTESYKRQTYKQDIQNMYDINTNRVIIISSCCELSWNSEI